MREKELHKKAIRLCEGSIEECSLHCVRMKLAPEDSDGCDVCEMDCICDMDMTDLCAEVFAILRKPCYLELVTNDL